MLEKEINNSESQDFLNFCFHTLESVDILPSLRTRNNCERSAAIQGFRVQFSALLHRCAPRNARNDGEMSTDPSQFMVIFAKSKSFARG